MKSKNESNAGFICAQVLNQMTSRMHYKREVKIATNLPNMVEAAIFEATGRESTVNRTNSDNESIDNAVVCCVSEVGQVPKIRKAAFAVGPNAFITVFECISASGRGFKDRFLD